MTGDGLTAFNQVSGPAGAQLVPDLATSLPTPTDGGRTYTFLLRSGIRYSTGRPVQATDFRSTFERDFALGSPTSDYDGIVGGAQCRKHPKRCDLSRGIVANDVARTVTFHLIRPDPDFLYKLAGQFAYVLPGSTPRRPAGTHPLPATGPYMIATYRPRRLLRFVRNPFFHEWSRAAQPDGYPDRIDIRIAGTADDAIRDVVDGKADVVWLAEPLTPKQVSRLEVRYASQMHTAPSPNLQALFLNTRVPPFNRLDARRAINFAVDRAAATNAWGGPSVAQTTCQILPPNFPDYRPYCPYTAGSTNRGTWTAPDLTKAKALVGTLRDARHEGHPLGVVAGKRLQPGGQEGAALARLPRDREADRRQTNTGMPLVTCETGRRSGSTAGRGAWTRRRSWLGSSAVQGLCPGARQRERDQFCDPRIDRQMRRAQAEQLSDPTGSRALWQRVDREITDAAPWVPLIASKNVSVLSKRVGNYQYSPAAVAMLIDQLWVR